MEFVRIEKIQFTESEKDVLQTASELLDDIAVLKQESGISECADIRKILNARDLIESFIYDKYNF